MPSIGSYIRNFSGIVFLFLFLFRVDAAGNLPSPLFLPDHDQHWDTPLWQNDSDDLSRSGKWKNYADRIKDARRIINKVRSAGNFISRLTGEDDLISLPVGIRTGDINDGFTATLVIEDIRIYQNYTRLFVILEIEAPVLGEQPLIFYSSDIKYSAQAGILGDATVALLEDFPVNVFDRKAMLVFKGGLPDPHDPVDTRTFARIGCDGFESMNIAADVIFSRDWLLPVNEPGEPRPSTRVTGSFNLKNINRPTEIYAAIDLGKFTVRGMEDFHWQASEWVMDMSEHQSPEFIHLSGDAVVYETQAGEKYHPLVEMGDTWKGFYAKKIAVSLPSRITGGHNVTIYAEDLIIDQAGISGYAGLFSEESLIEFGNVSLNGWAFSIDGFEVVVTENENWAAEFGGLIYIPLFSEKGGKDSLITTRDALDYVATIDPENGYLFTTGPAREMDMDLWLASARILPTTSITLGYVKQEETLVARAVIDADIGISASLGEKLDLHLPQLGVRQLIVQNIGNPIILNTHAWEVVNNDPVNLGIFEFGFDLGDRDMLTGATQNGIPEPIASLDMKSFVKLAKTEKLTGRGGFSISGKMVGEKGLKRWTHKDFGVKEIFVSGRNVIPGLKYLEGSLLFYENHKDYGSGFRGSLTLEMINIIEEAKAIAQFGTYTWEDEAKGYYFVDLSALLERGIPLGGAFYLRGIGGGFYRNMLRPAAAEAFSEITFRPLTKAFFTSSIGESMSGIRYDIDRNGESFGFRASTVVSSPPSGTGLNGLSGEKTLFNANLELGMQFSKNKTEDAYGLQMIYFQGVGEFMGEIDLTRRAKEILNEGLLENLTGFQAEDLSVSPSTKRPNDAELPITDARISAKVLIQANLDCPEFHGLLGVYVNAGILYGKAYADLLISRNCNNDNPGSDVAWHMFIGHLTEPVMLGLRVPVMGDLLTVRSYFMAGNEGIPSVLPAPADYVSLFDKGLLNKKYGGYPGAPYPNSRPAVQGSGFAAGMSMQIGTPPEGMKFLFMYATLQGGIGFDIMVTRYLESECFDEVGINGWYGKGQAWLYANAEIGAQVRLGFMSFRIKAFQAAAGAMLRVEGPDPFFGTGRLDARLNLLGLLNTNLRFKVTVGSSIEDSLPESCLPELSPLEIPIIENVTSLLPAENGAYPPGTSFIIQTNYDLDQVISDPDQPGKKYRIAVPMQGYMNFENYEKTRAEETEIRVLDGKEPEGEGHSPQEENKVTFPSWFTIKDESFRSLSFTYRAYPNAYGGTNFLVTPTEPLPENEIIRISPRGYILHARPSGDDYFYTVMKGYIDDPVYTFKILPGIEDYRIREEEVAAAYPASGMTHFYLEETKGVDFGGVSFTPAYWVTLNRSKSHIVERIPTGYDLVARIVDSEGRQVGDLMEVENIQMGKREMYIFSENAALTVSSAYVLQMIYQETQMGSGEFGSEVILYECPFMTSKYSMLENKLAAMVQSEYSYIDGDADQYCEGDYMEFEVETDEAFDDLELLGKEGIIANVPRLVTFRYKDDECNGMGWIARHQPSCALVRFFGLCAGEILPDHLREHPGNSIDIAAQGEGTITFSSSLPATIFDVNKYAYEASLLNFCGEVTGPSEDISLDCGIVIRDLFCSDDYDFPRDPGEENYIIEAKYVIPFGESPFPSKTYSFVLNGKSR